MAIPTVNQLAIELVKEIGESTSNSTYITKVEQWIQECIDAIGIAKRWHYLYAVASLNTVASTRTYNLTATFEQEIAARFTNGSGILTNETKETIINAGENLTRTGKPNLWYVDAYDVADEVLTIGLFPVPDAVYTIEFLGKLVPQELVSASKLPFPRSFVAVLKDGVRSKTREDDGNYVGAQLSYRKFLQGISNLQSLTLYTAKTHRLGYSDIPSRKDELVKLPPDHFQN